MFTIKNSSITNEKVLNIGTTAIYTVQFQFQDVEFADEDVLTLSIGSNEFENYSFTNEGYVKFVRIDFDFLTSDSESKTITMTKNGDTILSDTITILSDIQGGGGGGNYVTPQQLSSTLSDYATTSYADGLINNKLKINTITDDTDTIAVAYNADYDIVEINNTTNTASLTINPCTGYTAVNGVVPTFELWIKPTTTKTTISISNQITQIGDLPTELESGATYCYVFRFVDNKQLLNYSYTLTDESSSSSDSSSSI